MIKLEAIHTHNRLWQKMDGDARTGDWGRGTQVPVET